MISSTSDETEETMSESVRELVREYISAAGDKRFDRLAELVHPDATLDGTVKAQAEGAEAFIQGFRNLAPIIKRNEVRDLVVEEDRAFVLYDFVTDTPVGSVLCGELLTIEDGLIRSSTLIFDWRRWAEVLQELQTRMDPAQQPERADA
jgi:SnoaL-like domain